MFGWIFLAFNACDDFPGHFQYRTFNMKAKLTIEYCPKCHWLMRAAYMAQEFLTTFADELQSVTLVPSEIGGRYIISVDDRPVFDRKVAGHFLEIKELKQLVRDVVNPGKDLGHSDKQD